MSITSPNASLKIYGTKTASEAYVDMLRKIAQPDKRIEFCGEYAANELGGILQAVDVVVVPSLWYENHPLMVSEALACNVPVIVSNVGGMTETVKDNFNGFAFSMGDVGQLAETFRIVSGNPEVLNQLKDNISRMTFPTVEQEAYAYERIYNEVCVPS